mgnify:CR=1 FL=1
MCSYTDSYETKLMPGRIMVIIVTTGVVLGAVGIYEPFVKFAGAGATVPLTGFGNVLWKGMKKAIDEQGFLGLFTGCLLTTAKEADKEIERLNKELADQKYIDQ